MKNLWTWILISALIGVSVAALKNYTEFGNRTAYFGPFGTDNDLTAAKLPAYRQSQLPDGRPKVKLVDEPSFDFGLMAPDTEGEHLFKIKNVGNGDLRLRLGASTCKCTFGDLEKEALAPGEETEIKLSWSVKPGLTEFSQSAEVITNDPDSVVIRLEITGQVAKEIDLVPETWTFGEVATGEPIEVTGTVYSFLETDINMTELTFSTKEMTELSEFTVEPFKPTEKSDGIRGVARQGFKVTAKIKPGLRQGAVSQNLVMQFDRLDSQGAIIPTEDGLNEFITAPTKGAIVGPLGMIQTSRLSGKEGGGYLYDFGRLAKGDNLIGKAFVVLKGSERDRTELRIGEVVPEGSVIARLGEPKGQGSMKLYPIEIELIPGKEPIERSGRNAQDYGSVWIESDNPKVTKMRIGLKFAVEAE
ncbi:DUF1573 domain-containing protein [bacterium]|nr:DUF1573 domain-containing protein [bacterium]